MKLRKNIHILAIFPVFCCFSLDNPLPAVYADFTERKAGKRMLTIYSSEKDKYNFHISDKPLEINSCGVNSSVGKKGPRNSFYVRRPEGRKDYQLLYISAGKAEHYLNGAWQTVYAGQAVIYLPDDPQYYLYQANVPVICKWLHFSGSMAESILQSCDLICEERIINLGEEREINALFDRILQERQLNPPCSETILPGLLYQLLGLMGRQRAILQDKNKYQARQRLMQAVESMHYHYDEPQSIDQYAEKCGMSRFHFSHAFREIVGQSPYAYLSQLRLDHARELLIGSDTRISDIARACGYDNPLYFSRIFSRKFSMPPSEYRKQYSIFRNLSADDLPQPEE